MRTNHLAVLSIATLTMTFAQVSVAATMYESADVLTPADALGRYQWLNKCYPGLLLEVHDQIFDPTNIIPNSAKIIELREALLYQNGQLRSNANYLTFGDENNENPQRWYAGTSTSDNCYQIPSDYQISSVMVASKLPSYCQAKSKDTEYEYIKSVSLAGVVNDSEAGTYSNYIGQTIELNKVDKTTIELTPGYTQAGESYYETFHIYVDWDQDGTFSGSNEIYMAGASKTQLSYTFTPPASAKTGLTKMRITMDYFGGSQNACDDIRTGEVEDYVLFVK